MTARRFETGGRRCLRPGVFTMQASVFIGAILTLALPLTACGSGDATQPVPTASATQDPTVACAPVDLPLLDIQARHDAEPFMRIPLPPGWQRSTELDGVDESIRMALAHNDLGVNGRPQNIVVVSVESLPDMDAQAIFDHLRVERAKTVEELGVLHVVTPTRGSVCGHPSETVVHTDVPTGLGTSNVRKSNTATFLSVVVQAPGHIYLIGVNATVESDKPSHQRDVETIVRGLQVLPAKSPPS